jgi:hypothetical protein
MFPAADDNQTLALQVSVLGKLHFDRFVNKFNLEVDPELYKSLRK